MVLSTSTPKQKRQLFVDIETFSSQPLPKCGVYRYSQAADFQILIVTYGYDDEELVTIDLACGELLPPDFLSALEDYNVLKIAHFAQFERVCFSRYLGHWLDPHQWRCSMIMANYLTLPGKLADVAVALNLTERKMEEGKDLIRYFSVPCKATKANGGRTRNLPGDAPDKWEIYKKYNRQDVETERAVVRALERYPLPELEWELYALDQIINDRGVRIDKQLVRSALIVDSEFTQKAYQRAQEITGLENPSSVVQLKAWLADQDMPMETLAKKVVQEKAKDAEGIVAELLHLRLELSKTSVKKYEAMARTVCKDGRVHGVTQFYGASRTGRWCLTADHEVLTDEGWKRLDEWSGGSIACWNATTQAVSFQKAEPLCFDYEGPMYSYKSSRIDQCSTPDHKMRVQPRYGEPWTDMTVAEMANRSRPCIPFTGYRYHRDRANPAWLRVLIMTQADGHYTEDGAVRYHFSKQRKIERCKMLLRKAEITHVCGRDSKGESKSAYTITIPTREVPLWLREFRSKTFGFWLLDEDPEIFFDELPYWDGYCPAPNSIQYCTTNRQNADIVQALAHMSGRSAIMRIKKASDYNDAYVLDIWQNAGNCHEIRTKPTVEAFSGKVYCAMTSTGYFLVRRHGKVWVTGNSGKLIQLQNLPQNHLPDLNLARDIVKRGDIDLLETLYDSVPNTLSELIRTALIPKDGCRFLVADFSAIEARTLAWLAGEEWVLEEFRGKGKIYEATAARMYHIPADTIIKGNPNYAYRQKGKQATLACIAEGELVLTNHGLKPIETITLDDLAWDGISWVRHEGLIYKGEGEVISYEGLTATPDHYVWIEGQSQPVQLGVAAASGAHLVHTGNGRNPVRLGRVCQRSSPNEAEELAYHKRPTRLYDLRNAGPHHRFTVSNHLVHNCGYGGGVGAMKNMGATMPDDELQEIVEAWRRANPHIVNFWSAMESSARQVVDKKITVPVGKTVLFWKDGNMFMRLPSGRDLCYQGICYTDNRFGNRSLGYYMPGSSGKMVLTETFGGKLAENCIAQGTLVLTDRGLVPIESITASHLIWDGEAFVSHEGLLNKGIQPVVAVDGIRTTPDHKILTEKGWIRCSSCNGLNWSTVSLPDRSLSCRKRASGDALSAGSQPAAGITVRETGRSEYVYDIKNCGPRHRFTVFDPITRQFHIVSNCTQAVARDILANSMLELEKAGYHIVFHVHDEVILEVPYDHGSLEDACAIMGIPPVWASDLPLRADGDELEYYRKM